MSRKKKKPAKPHIDWSNVIDFLCKKYYFVLTNTRYSVIIETWKGGGELSRKKKKPAKPHIDWSNVIVNAIADLIIGILLLIAGKYIK